MSDKELTYNGFRMLSLGCSGAGKSMSVFEWVCILIKRKIVNPLRVVVFSPTVKSDSS